LLPAESHMRDVVTICAKCSKLQLKADHSAIRTLSLSRRSHPLTLLEFITMACVAGHDILFYNNSYANSSSIFANALFDRIHMKFGDEVSLKKGKVRPMTMQLERLLKLSDREWRNVL